MKQRKTIYTSRQPFFNEGPAMRLQQLALNTFLADCIISISETITQFCQTSYYASSKKIIKISIAVGTYRFWPEVSGTAVRAKRDYLMCFPHFFMTGPMTSKILNSSFDMSLHLSLKMD